MGSSTGISFMDSTPLRVCKNKRISRNKVFEGIAGLGKSTMGFFFGFKLHLVVNDKGEILNFVLTRGNVDDRQPLIDEDTLHIHLISASEEYQSEPSLKDLKKKLEESDDRIKVTASWGEDEGEDLPDIELLEEAASSNR